jgi:hypothetical protein
MRFLTDLPTPGRDADWISAAIRQFQRLVEERA